MKTVLNGCLLFLFSFTIGCTGSASKEENTDQAIETDQQTLDGMQEIDLSNYQLNATLHIPDDSKGKVDVIATDWGSIEIIAGNYFGIEVIPFGMSKADKKAELASDLVYDVEYIDEKENSILYKKSIKDSDIEPEFHFFISTMINGDLVEIKNLNETSFSKAQIEKMLQSGLSLSEKSPS